MEVSDSPAIDRSQVVYRLYGSGSQLLYIGVARDPGRRFAAYRRTAHWWAEVETITLERFSTREEAEMAEAQAIANEAPTHNSAGRLPGAAARPDGGYVPTGPLLNRMIRVPDDLWDGLAKAVGPRHRGQVLREFMAWYLQLPGAELPARPMLPSNDEAVAS